MRIKEVHARIILDSRKEETIEIYVDGFTASSPSGKSKGKYEKQSFVKNIQHDFELINKFDASSFPEINEFRDLEDIEEVIKDKVGANTLFALELATLRALANEKKRELWEVISPDIAKIEKSEIKFPKLLSNTIGGGVHSHNKIKPDFQEFLVTCNKFPSLGITINKKAYEEAGIILNNLTMHSGDKNDEHAWQTDLDNEAILEVMKDIEEDIFDDTSSHMNIGIDVASSQFFDKGKYNYRNKIASLSSEDQIDYIFELIKKYGLSYVEDPLEEEDFDGFSKLLEKVENKCIIVGDDLTVTNLERVRKAIEKKSINGIIIKPNQTGSLIEAKKVSELCKKNKIFTIVSHRSGETLDSGLADIAFAFQADFIKIPVVGKEREVKVNRLIEIERSMR